MSKSAMLGVVNLGAPDHCMEIPLILCPKPVKRDRD